MTRTEMTKIIAGTISGMWKNNAEIKYTESFVGWCEDGDSLPEENNEELTDLMKEVAPYVDKISGLFSEFIEK